MAMNKQASVAVINTKTLQPNESRGVLSQNDDKNSTKTFAKDDNKQRVMQLAASRATLNNNNESDQTQIEARL